MADVVVLQEGEEPKDARNFVLVEQIPAPRGLPRYRVVAQGVNDDGPVGIQKTVDSLELAREWAEDIAGGGTVARLCTCAVPLAVARVGQTVPDPPPLINRPSRDRSQSPG